MESSGSVAYCWCKCWSGNERCGAASFESLLDHQLENVPVSSYFRNPKQDEGGGRALTFNLVQWSVMHNAREISMADVRSSLHLAPAREVISQDLGLAQESKEGLPAGDWLASANPPGRIEVVLCAMVFVATFAILLLDPLLSI